MRSCQTTAEHARLHQQSSTEVPGHCWDADRLLCMLLAALRSDPDHSSYLWWRWESSALYRLLFQSELLQSSSGLGEILNNIFRLSVRGRTSACHGPGLLIPEVMVDKVGQNHVACSALTGYTSAVWCSSRTLWWVTQAADIIWLIKCAAVLGTSGHVLLFGSLGRKPITVWCSFHLHFNLLKLKR